MSVEGGAPRHFRGRPIGGMTRGDLVHELFRVQRELDALEAERQRLRAVASARPAPTSDDTMLWIALALIAGAAFGGYLWGIGQCP
jgi:hypothetical protein